MCIKEFDFHDSCVNKLEYRDDSIFLDIDLCMWKQNDYKEGQQELKRVVLKFLDVKNYNWDSEKTEEDIDYDSIISATYNENNVKIVMGDDVVSVLSFECSGVIFDY